MVRMSMEEILLRLTTITELIAEDNADSALYREKQKLERMLDHKVDDMFFPRTLHISTSVVATNFTDMVDYKRKVIDRNFYEKAVECQELGSVNYNGSISGMKCWENQPRLFNDDCQQDDDSHAISAKMVDRDLGLVRKDVLTACEMAMYVLENCRNGIYEAYEIFDNGECDCIIFNSQAFNYVTNVSRLLSEYNRVAAMQHLAMQRLFTLNFYKDHLNGCVKVMSDLHAETKCETVMPLENEVSDGWCRLAVNKTKAMKAINVIALMV